ncbi:hypothetical protein PROFUN_13265 [Planoprotostelium fungivorum]|uniref:RNA helicase n=1 Tax=Planoprotostelium fungivorum TaxID=1890364 RepID=A0A2P6N4T0_9EUKA|nr:hypothetical protein PROFUN_13265 [Planoprotostelium fungivorum]
MEIDEVANFSLLSRVISDIELEDDIERKLALLEDVREEEPEDTFSLDAIRELAELRFNNAEAFKLETIATLSEVEDAISLCTHKPIVERKKQKLSREDDDEVEPTLPPERTDTQKQPENDDPPPSTLEPTVEQDDEVGQITEEATPTHTSSSDPVAPIESPTADFTPATDPPDDPPAVSMLFSTATEERVAVEDAEQLVVEDMDGETIEAVYRFNVEQQKREEEARIRMAEMEQELRRIQEEKVDLERKRLEEERARQQRLEKARADEEARIERLMAEAKEARRRKLEEDERLYQEEQMKKLQREQQKKREDEEMERRRLEEQKRRERVEAEAAERQRKKEEEERKRQEELLEAHRRAEAERLRLEAEERERIAAEEERDRQRREKERREAEELERKLEEARRIAEEKRQAEEKARKLREEAEAKRLEEEAKRRAEVEAAQREEQARLERIRLEREAELQRWRDEERKRTEELAQLKAQEEERQRREAERVAAEAMAIKRSEASVTIQRGWRRIKERRRQRDFARQKRDPTANLAATNIQKMWKGYWVRKRFKRVLASIMETVSNGYDDDDLNEEDLDFDDLDFDFPEDLDIEFTFPSSFSVHRSEFNEEDPSVEPSVRQDHSPRTDMKSYSTMPTTSETASVSSAPELRSATPMTFRDGLKTPSPRPRTVASDGGSPGVKLRNEYKPQAQESDDDWHFENESTRELWEKRLQRDNGLTRRHNQQVPRRRRGGASTTAPKPAKEVPSPSRKVKPLERPHSLGSSPGQAWDEDSAIRYQTPPGKKPQPGVQPLFGGRSASSNSHSEVFMDVIDETEQKRNQRTFGKPLQLNSVADQMLQQLVEGPRRSSSNARPLAPPALPPLNGHQMSNVSTKKSTGAVGRPINPRGGIETTSADCGVRVKWCTAENVWLLRLPAKLNSPEENSRNASSDWHAPDASFDWRTTRWEETKTTEAAVESIERRERQTKSTETGTIPEIDIKRADTEILIEIEDTLKMTSIEKTREVNRRAKRGRVAETDREEGEVQKEDVKDVKMDIDGKEEPVESAQPATENVEKKEEKVEEKTEAVVKIEEEKKEEEKKEEEMDPEKKKELEERRRRLEAWKKMKEQSEPEKLQEVVEEKKVPAVPEVKAAEVKVEAKKDNTIKGSFSGAFSLKKDTTKKKAIIMEDSQEDKKSLALADDADDVDPLDAFMAGLEEQVTSLHLIKKLRAEQVKSQPQEDKSSKGGNLGQKYFDSDEDQPGEDVPSEEEQEEEEDEESALLKKLRKKTLAPVDHTKIEYVPFKKDFYIEVPEIARMTPQEIDDYRAQLENIRVRGGACPTPIKNFAQAGLSNKILQVLQKLQYNKPTPIQCQAIPAIMAGRDIIGCAKTGSGKTLCFLLPLLRHIMDQPPIKSGDGPIALVVAPTRELAMQIHAEFKKFTKPLNLGCVCVYGGSGVASQISELKRGCEIVVCTPGRMIDILCTNAGKVTNLQRISFLVLDEADRMFDMGFEPQITRIITNIQPGRQTVLFSATFPRAVEVLARRILTKPLEIIVGERSVVCSDVTQIVEVREGDTKFRRLLELLRQYDDKGSIIIFVDRQEAADKLFNDITKAGYPCAVLHGGMEQEARDFTLDDFKRKVTNIMVATSVAARGLDVKGLNLVVNYDVPNHMEDYVHRVGRTGRNGAKGTAYTFISPEEDKYAPDIVRAMENSKTAVPPELKALMDQYNVKRNAGTAEATGSGYGGKGFKFDQNEAMQKEEERKRMKRAYGLDDGQEEDEEEEERPNQLLQTVAKEVKKVPAPTDAKDGAPTAKPLPGLPGVADTKKAADAAALAAAAIAAKLKDPAVLTQKEEDAKKQAEFTDKDGGAQVIEIAPGTTVTLAPTKGMSVAEQALVQVLGKKAQTASGFVPLAPAASEAERKRRLAAIAGMSKKAQDLIPGEHFFEELEINDFPQQARWKVTHKDALSAIQEWTNTAVTTKGTFVAPGRNPPPGERKLHLYIEGEDMQSVKKAKSEILRILDEVMVMHVPEREKPQYGKNPNCREVRKSFGLVNRLHFNVSSRAFFAVSITVVIELAPEDILLEEAILVPGSHVVPILYRGHPDNLKLSLKKIQ